MVIGSSYRPARLHRLEELIPWNRFLGSLTVNNSGYDAADRQSAGHVVSTKNVSYIDCRPNTLLYSLTGRKMLSGGSYNDTGKTVVPYRLFFMGCIFSCTGPDSCPAELQLEVGSCRLGGILCVYVWLEYSYDPAEGHPGHSLRTLSWFVSYRRFASKFQYSLSAVILDIYLGGQHSGQGLEKIIWKTVLCLWCEGVILFYNSVHYYKYFLWQYTWAMSIYRNTALVH